MAGQALQAQRASKLEDETPAQDENFIPDWTGKEDSRGCEAAEAARAELDAPCEESPEAQRQRSAEMASAWVALSDTRGGDPTVAQISRGHAVAEGRPFEKARAM